MGWDLSHTTGNTAWNIPMSSASYRWMQRHVARKTGTISTYYLYTRVAPTGTGYASGTTGQITVTFHPVNTDGTPDLGTTYATYGPVTPSAVASSNYLIAATAGFSVSAGDEFCVVTRNTDGSPGTNWWSMNHMAFFPAAIYGALAINNRDPDYDPTYYGLHPLENVGWSSNSGSTWTIPANPATATGNVHQPTYMYEYSTGEVYGQPYYYGFGSVGGTNTIVYPNVPEEWTITHLAAYNHASSGSGTLTVLVNDVAQGSVSVSGTKWIRTALSTPVVASPGDTVKVRISSHSLTLTRCRADNAAANIIGLGSSYAVYWAERATNDVIIPLYAAPRYDQYSDSIPASRQVQVGVAGTSALDVSVSKTPNRKFVSAAVGASSGVAIAAGKAVPGRGNIGDVTAGPGR